jgi:hypothetical protein
MADQSERCAYYNNRISGISVMGAPAGQPAKPAIGQWHASYALSGALFDVVQCATIRSRAVPIEGG